MLNRGVCIFAGETKQLFNMEWDIKTLDCSKMLINPLHPKLVNFIEKEIPSMATIEVDYQAKVFTKTMVYRYILLMYDKDSPVQKMHALDHFEKKYEACGYSGFKLTKGRDGYMRFDERVNDMVLGKIDAINDLIIEFLGYVNNAQWDYLVFLHESMLGFTRDAIGKKNRDAKTSKEFRALYDDYYKISNEIGHTFEETEEFVSRFYYKIEQSRLAVRPEDFAKAIDEGDDLYSDSPYPSGYVIEKIKFLGDDEESIKE